MASTHAKTGKIQKVLRELISTSSDSEGYCGGVVPVRPLAKDIKLRVPQTTKRKTALFTFIVTSARVNRGEKSVQLPFLGSIIFKEMRT